MACAECVVCLYGDVVSMRSCTALKFSPEDAIWLGVSETKGKKVYIKLERWLSRKARLTTKKIRNVYIEE